MAEWPGAHAPFPAALTRVQVLNCGGKRKVQAQGNVLRLATHNRGTPQGLLHALQTLQALIMQVPTPPWAHFAASTARSVVPRPNWKHAVSQHTAACTSTCGPDAPLSAPLKVSTRTQIHQTRHMPEQRVAACSHVSRTSSPPMCVRTAGSRCDPASHPRQAHMLGKVYSVNAVHTSFITSWHQPQPGASCFVKVDPPPPSRSPGRPGPPSAASSRRRTRV